MNLYGETLSEFPDPDNVIVETMIMIICVLGLMFLYGKTRKGKNIK